MIELLSILKYLQGWEGSNHVVHTERRVPGTVDLGKLDVDVLLPQSLGRSLILGSKRLAMSAVAHVSYVKILAAGP